MNADFQDSIKTKMLFGVYLRDYLMNGDGGFFPVSPMDLLTKGKKSVFQGSNFGWLGKTSAGFVFPVPVEKGQRKRPLFGPGIKDRQNFCGFIPVALHQMGTA